MICIADKNTLPFPSAQGVDCLLLDSEKDLDYLSAHPPMGCVAFILSTGDFYVSTGESKWVHYDKNKEVVGSVSTAQYREDLSRGGDIKVKDMKISPETSRAGRIVISKDTTFDFGNHTITLEAGFGTGDATNVAAFYVSGGHVTLNGAYGGIYANDLGTNDGPHCVIIEDGGEVEVNGGIYQGGATAFFVGEGTLIINDGVFASYDKQSHGTGDPHSWVLNCRDSSYKEGKAKIVVRGGTFIDFDPSNPKTNDADSYVDANYKVEKSEVDGHIYYTVLKK